MNIGSKAQERITFDPQQQILDFLKASTSIKKTDSSFKGQTFN